MDSNSKAVDTLKIFYQYFDVPEKLVCCGSKEQACKGTTFVKEVHRQGIYYYISEPDLHIHNPGGGVIRELRHKCSKLW